MQDYALSPTLDWEESLLDGSALLSCSSLDPTHTSLGSPISPLLSTGQCALPVEKFNLDTDVQLSSFLKHFDNCYGQDEQGVCESPSTFTDGMTHEPLFESNEVLPENPGVFQHVDLCSTSPLWEQCQSDYRIGNDKSSLPLSPAEEERLRSIAMPAQSYPASSVSFCPSPERQGTPNRCRRTSSESSESDCLVRRGRRQINKKTAHNVIEKRYRTNLVEKINVLRDSIPSLRTIGEGISLDGDFQDVQVPPKLNKATILSKATEYIIDLEEGTRNLTRENRALKTRIEAFRILVKAQHSSDSE